MIKINYWRFLGRLSRNDTIANTNSFWNQYFLSTKAIWESEKRELMSYLSAWGCDQRLCLKILSSRKNEIYLWKM